jgi:hypothetical protein
MLLYSTLIIKRKRFISFTAPHPHCTLFLWTDRETSLQNDRQQSDNELQSSGMAAKSAPKHKRCRVRTRLSPGFSQLH